MEQDTKANTQEIEVAGMNNAPFLFWNKILKYLLYRKYFAPDSVWEMNKKGYWEFEKAILLWSWSHLHQHFNSSALNTGRIVHIFNGELSEMLGSRKVAELKRMFSEQEEYFIYAVMGNLYRKGFVSALMGKDRERFHKLAEEVLSADNASSEMVEALKPIKRWLRANYFEVTNMYVNDIGLTAGEVAYELSRRWGLAKFSYYFLYVLEPVLEASLLFALLAAFVNIFQDVKEIFNEVSFELYVGLVLVVLILSSTRRIYKLISQRPVR